MKTFLAILGILAILLLIWFIGFKRGIGLNLFANNSDQNTIPEDNCDPNRSGWNKDGFPDINCGFGGG